MENIINSKLHEPQSGFIIEIRGERILTKDYQPGLFYYHIRHSDNDWGKPITLEKFVLVNHFGTLISTICLDNLFGVKDFYQFKVSQRSIIYNHEDCGFFDGQILFNKLA